ncbi:MAG: LPS assembly lipoprotein LptE [Myxococcaceae bacterium]
MRRSIGILLATLAAGVVGCGYRFTGVPRLAGDVTAVTAPVFRNATSEPGLEVVFSQRMNELLAHAGVLSPTADTRLEGEILSVGTAPGMVRNSAATGRSFYASFRVSGSIRVTLRQAEKVLGEAVASGNEDYLPDDQDDVLRLEAQRQAALFRLAETLVRDAYDQLTAG